MRSTLRIILAAVAIVLPLVACSSGSSLPPLETAKADDTNYRLGPGDKLHIQVLGAEDLTGDYAVGDNGTVSTPMIGDVKATGMTRAQLERAMEQKLAQGYLRNPKVSVTILTYRPFYILGEVQKPGEYPYTNGLSVVNAVATANGFTYRANTKRVFIKRANSSTEEEYPLDSSTPVAPGDTIRVAERFF